MDIVRIIDRKMNIGIASCRRNKCDAQKPARYETDSVL
jgi:hypothetical protein